MQQRNINGTFKRIRKLFSLDNFNDGYVDNRGRFRVWLPDHPRAYNSGYIFRSIVAYEMYHDVKVPPEMDIHHKDNNILNDSKENLVMIPHSVHKTKYHTGRGWVDKICQYCGETFKIERWRLKEPTRGKFCSQKCYKQKGFSEAHKLNIGKGLKKAYAENRR